MPQSSTLDKSTLERLFRLGGKRLVSQIIELFFKETPTRLQIARESLQSNDMDAVARVTHSLKTSAANVGAPEISRLAEKVEQCAFEGNREPIPALLNQLDRAWKDVQGPLEKELAESKS